jgi:hypothetical protein
MSIAPCCLGLFAYCDKISQFCENIFSEPLSCTLTLAFVAMGPVGLLAALGATEDLEGCKGPMMIWFIIAFVECVGHIVYAVYGFMKVRSRNRDKENFYMALYKLLVLNPWTALYIIFDIFGLVWSVLGMRWNNHCPDRVYGDSVAIGLVLWICFSYFMMIFNLFYESMENIICFLCFCFPYMLVPCCFSETLKRSYQRQEKEYGDQRFQLNNHAANHNNQAIVQDMPPAHQNNHGVEHARGHAVHPVPPQVHPVTTQENQEESKGSSVFNLASDVGSYLWNKAVKRENTSENNGIGRV